MHLVLLSVGLLACREPPTIVPNRSVAPSGVLHDCPPGPGVICPWAGAGHEGWNGDDLPRLDAWLSQPMNVAVPEPGPGRRLVIADWNNHMLRAVNETELEGFETVFETHLPNGGAYFADGRLVAATDSRLVTWDPQHGGSGTLLGEDQRGFALDDQGAPLDFGQPAETALMSSPASPVVDPADQGVLFYADQANERVRRYDLVNQVIDTVMGETADASGDGLTGTPGWCGQGDALQTCLAFPREGPSPPYGSTEPGAGLAVSGDGRVVYVADSGNDLIWKLELGPSRATVLSGTPGVAGFADGAAADALWSHPVGLALDRSTGELFVADTDNHRVRVIDLAAGTVGTVAGTGEPSCPAEGEDLVPCDNQQDGGDGGLAVDATLYRPFGVDLDVDGSLLISDTYDDRIRIVYR